MTQRNHFFVLKFPLKTEITSSKSHFLCEVSCVTLTIELHFHKKLIKLWTIDWSSEPVLGKKALVVSTHNGNVYCYLYDNSKPVKSCLTLKLDELCELANMKVSVESLGKYPLDINIKCRMLCFWSRLMTTEKLSSKIYKLLFKLYAYENSQTLYVKNIQNILDNLGLSFIFRNQMPVNIIWVKTHVKQILIDQFIQNWRSEIGNSSRGHFYSLFKEEFCSII